MKISNISKNHWAAPFNMGSVLSFVYKYLQISEGKNKFDSTKITCLSCIRQMEETVYLSTEKIQHL